MCLPSMAFQYFNIFVWPPLFYSFQKLTLGQCLIVKLGNFGLQNVFQLPHLNDVSHQRFLRLVKLNFEVGILGIE